MEWFHPNWPWSKVSLEFWAISQKPGGNGIVPRRCLQDFKGGAWRTARSRLLPRNRSLSGGYWLTLVSAGYLFCQVWEPELPKLYSAFDCIRNIRNFLCNYLTPLILKPLIFLQEYIELNVRTTHPHRWNNWWTLWGSNNDWKTLVYERKSVAEERFVEGNGHDYGNNGIQESVNPHTRLPWRRLPPWIA